jgi:iron(III) transport system permease protein
VLFVPALLVALLALLPLLFIVGIVVDIGLGSTIKLVVRPRTGELLSNTALLMAGAILACFVVGTGTAWLVELSDLPARRLWNALLVVPLAVPSFVTSFGWVSLTPRVEGFAGALFILTLSYFPLVYLPVAAALRGLDPALQETAQTLGNGQWRTFARVVLPQLRWALLGGGLLVGLHVLSEFGALQLLRFPTFTTAIFDQYQSSFNGPAANALAGVLVLFCLVLLLIELRLRGRARYARVGSGTARAASPVRLSRARMPVLLAVAALVVLAVGVPVASLVRWLAEGSSVDFPVRDLASATATSVGLGLLAAAVTSVLALPVAWLTVRHRGRASALVERCVYLGGALPGIVVALTLVTFALRWARPAYQTSGLLVVSYVILFLPLAVVSQRAAVAQVRPVLEDVAHALGDGPLRTLRRVTLPLLAPGVGAGAALVFLAVVTELTTTLLLSPIGTDTLATQFWQSASSLEYGAAAPFAALMMIISAPATWLLTRATTRR